MTNSRRDISKRKRTGELSRRESTNRGKKNSREGMMKGNAERKTRESDVKSKRKPGKNGLRRTGHSRKNRPGNITRHIRESKKIESGTSVNSRRDAKPSIDSSKRREKQEERSRQKKLKSIMSKCD